MTHSSDAGRLSARALLAFNVMGGLAILATYGWGVFTPGLGRALWGGVPESLQGVYVVSMLSATLGYFPFTALLLRIPAAQFRAETGRPYSLLFLFYGGILVGSAFWLPLTAWMLASPGSVLWAAVRVDLAAVGFGGLGVLWSVAKIARARPQPLPVLAVVGAVFFVIQTAILDAVIWPSFWSG